MPATNSPSSIEADNHEISAGVILISLSSDVNQIVNGSNQVKQEHATNTFKLPLKKRKDKLISN